MYGLYFSKFTPKLPLHTEAGAELKQSGILHGQRMEKTQWESAEILDFLNNFEGYLSWTQEHI